MLAYESLTAAVAAQSVPYPELAVALSTLLLAMGGTSVILGLMPRIGLGMIMLFLVPATCIMHAFWAVPDTAAQSMQLAMFMKNVALFGAALALFATPVPWPLSLDRWLEENGHHFGGDALAGSSQRFISNVKRALHRVRTRSSPRTDSLARAAPEQPESSWLGGDSPSNVSSYVVRRWVAWSDGDGVIAHGIRAYRIG